MIINETKKEYASPVCRELGLESDAQFMIQTSYHHEVGPDA